MIHEIETGKLVEYARAAHGVVVAPTLASSLESLGDEQLAVSWPASEDLASIYASRLNRWHSGLGPTCIGLDHFVETLENTAGTVGLFSHKDNSYFFVGVLNGDGTRLLDATSVDRRPER